MSPATVAPIGLHHLIFVHVTALPSWLRLSRPERAAVVAEHAGPALAAYSEVTVRWIDVEAFTAESSDVLLCETDDLRAWNRFFEALRDTPIFAQPYFRLDRILIGAEEGYRDYEESTPRA